MLYRERNYCCTAHLLNLDSAEYSGFLHALQTK